MLSKLTLTFQCHQNKVFDLAPITVFVGDNDAGKSAVIRSLKWLALNQWDGEAGQQIPWGTEEASVEAVTDKGVVSRVRLKDTNTYFVDGQELKAFGTTVPERVKSVLNLTEENFQEQEDPQFWLMLSSGQAAQALNEIFNLTLIDDSLAFIGKEQRDNNAQIKIHKAKIEQQEQTKTLYAWVPECEKRFKELLVERSLLSAKEYELMVYKNNVTSLSKVQDRLTRLSKDIMTIGEAAVQSTETYFSLLNKRESLQDLVVEYERLQLIEEKLCLKQKQLDKFLKGRCPLCNRQ